MNRLAESFTLEELRATLQSEQFRMPDGATDQDQAEGRGSGCRRGPTMRYISVGSSNYLKGSCSPPHPRSAMGLRTHALFVFRMKTGRMFTIDLHRLRRPGRDAGTGPDVRFHALPVYHAEWSGRTKQGY